MTLVLFLCFLVFLIGLYFYLKSSIQYSEGLTTNNKRCPNLLIQKGSKFYLFNSSLAKVPGVNPIEFDNLEDYTEFLNWQRSQNIRCPVLYLQETYDVQGNRVYKSRPSVSDMQGGLPPLAQVQPMYEPPLEQIGEPAYSNQTLLVDATRNDPPYNQSEYPSYDPSSYYIGTTTPLDNMNIQQQSEKISPNPMDDNWGGQSYTQELIDKGYYKENEVQIKIS